MDRWPAATNGHLPPRTPRATGRRSRCLARKAAVACVVLAASFVAVPSAHAADCTPGSYPPAQCTAEVSATVVPQGGSLTVAGPGFAPESSVSIDIRSEVVHLKTTDAEENGWVRARVRIPDDLEEGNHTLMLTGRNPDGSARQLTASLLVVEGGHGGTPGEPGNDQQGEAGVLAHTGVSGTTDLAMAGAVLLGAGGLTLRLVRRRRRSRAS